MKNNKIEIINLSLRRRQFLKAGLATLGGLVLGVRVFPAASESPSPTIHSMNAFVRIAENGEVTVLVPQSEMGQGVYTSLPMMVAEELEVSMGRVRVEAAPVGGAYRNKLIKQQLTGGSTSVRAFYEGMRLAGARAREMLVTIASRRAGVSRDVCSCREGQVVARTPGGEKIFSYGELAGEAAKLPVPETVTLKAPAEFKIIGRPVKRLDTPHKVNGKAVYGIDVKVTGMACAAIKMCPHFGGKLKSFDPRGMGDLKGILGVVDLPDGVAVVAEHYYQAKRALDRIKVEWEGGATIDSQELEAQFRELLKGDGIIAHHSGNTAEALQNGKEVIEAEYFVPFLHHATMEPMNGTAEVKREACRLILPTQGQDHAQQGAALWTKLPLEKITVETTYLGGGFGRRFERDFAEQAVNLSERMGRPVKVIWSREEDMAHGFYRPSALSRFRAILGADGLPVAWENKIVCPSIMKRVFPLAVMTGLDHTSVEGAFNLPYAIPHQTIRYVMADTPVPVGFWRSVGSSFNAFFVECFLDELALAAKRDPLDYRLFLLAAKPRFQAVLKEVARMADWSGSLPRGRARGIAIHESFGSIVAQVAEIEAGGPDGFRIRRVFCAVDCGRMVNPDTVEAQMEGGVNFGLSALLRGHITLEKGAVKQSNFHDYPLLNFREAPEVVVTILPSDEPPGGIGEPGVPPIAPAVVNALRVLNKVSHRRLPLSPRV